MMTEKLHEIFRKEAERWTDAKIKWAYRMAEETNRTPRPGRKLFYGVPPTMHESLLRTLWKRAQKEVSLRPDISGTCTARDIADAFLRIEGFDRKNFRYDRNRFRFRTGHLEVRAYKESSQFGTAVELNMLGRSRDIPMPPVPGISGLGYVEIILALEEFFPEAEDIYRRVTPAAEQLRLAHDREKLLYGIMLASGQLGSEDTCPGIIS